MKNKTIVLVFSLILIVLGLVFGIKYFLKSQSTGGLIASKIETTSTAVQSEEDIENAKQQAAYDRLRERAASSSIIDTMSSSTLSPEYVLDQLFSKDHWPHGFDPNKPVITDTVEGIIIRNDNVKIIEKTMTASSTLLRYNVVLKYPQFSGFSNTVNQEKLNKRIEDEVKKVLKQFQDDAKLSVNSYLDKINHNTLYFKWDIYVSKKELVSMRLISQESYETLRHAVRNTVSFSYDVVSGQDLSLKDFFIPGSDFISRIRDIANERNALPDDSSFRIVFATSTHDTADLLNCLMTERGIVCGYDYAAQVGEYFKGVSIEWKDLEDILNLELVNRLRE